MKKAMNNRFELMAIYFHWYPFLTFSVIKYRHKLFMTKISLSIREILRVLTVNIYRFICNKAIVIIHNHY